MTLDVSHRFQTIDGFGSSLRLFDDPHVTNTSDPVTGRGGVVVPPDQQTAILRALYTDIGLTRVRYTTDANIEPVNDNANPNVTDLTKFNFSWRGGDGFISLVNAARPLGLTRWWGSPITPGESWMGANDVPEYVEWALAIIRHWNSSGTPLTYWSLFNEPRYFSGLGNRSPEFMRDAIKAIGAQLVAENIPTRIVASDDVNPESTLLDLRVILADPVARQYIRAIATHIYGNETVPVLPNLAALDQLAALAQQYNLPLWMTEWFNPDWFTWAKTMHSLLSDYNVSAVDYLWGYFGTWEPAPAQLIAIQSIGTQYTGFIRTKQYWVMGQYSAYVRPGTVRVAADASTSPALRVTAYYDGTRIVIVALNTSSNDKPIRFELGGGIPCVRNLAMVRTSPFESGRQLDPVILDAPHFVTTLPAMSITTLIAQ